MSGKPNQYPRHRDRATVDCDALGNRSTDIGGTIDIGSDES
jgi:hypothetical protein